MFDLTIRNGTVVTATETIRRPTSASPAGASPRSGRASPAGARDIDARGPLVLPGGIDSHCHVEQLSVAWA